MTNEELMARIAELEAENAKLKDEVNGIGKKRPAISIKLKFRDKYPWVGHMGDDMRNSLSLIVRKVCFEKIDKECVRCYGNDKRKVKNEYALSPKDMTEEQAERYYEICGKILGVLDEYEVVTESVKKWFR